MATQAAILTAKGQETAPKAVRKALGLRQGEQLSEWSRTADQEAFQDP